MKIGSLSLDHPAALAPMAGMTDTAFRRLVKGHGGCGLVVTEMVSSEGLVRGIDRTLEYAEYTEAERPVSIQIFGGKPDTMAEAARIVAGMGADVVDINMGCPVPKIASHHAGCTLMRDPAHAASIIRAMAKAVDIPVTVKMRAGWNEHEINAPVLARMAEDAGAAAVAVHGRTAAQSYSGESDWSLIARVAEGVRIPVFGSGDCVDPGQIVARAGHDGIRGVLVGRGALRNPWIFRQAADATAGRSITVVTPEMRGQFLIDYLTLLLNEGLDEADGFRHKAGDRTSEVGFAGTPEDGLRGRVIPARGRERWVINKLRALGSWYTKGLDGGSRLRVAINSAESIEQLREIISNFFFAGPETTAIDRVPVGADS